MIQTLRDIKQEIDDLKKACSYELDDEWGRERNKERYAKIRGLERAMIIVHRNNGR